VNHPDRVTPAGRVILANPQQGNHGPRPVVTPRGQQLLVSRTVRDVTADADVTLEDRAGTPSRTSTAAHSSSRSQDPEQAGVIDGLPDQLPAAVALHRYAKGCGRQPLCGRARRHGNGQPTYERAGQAGTGLVGFEPRCASSLIG
jgi:hypothetical protein